MAPGAAARMAAAAWHQSSRGSAPRIVVPKRWAARRKSRNLHVSSAQIQPPSAPMGPNAWKPIHARGTVNPSFNALMRNMNRFWAHARMTPSSGSAAMGMEMIERRKMGTAARYRSVKRKLISAGAEMASSAMVGTNTNDSRATASRNRRSAPSLSPLASCSAMPSWRISETGV